MLQGPKKVRMVMRVTKKEKKKPIPATLSF